MNKIHYAAALAALFLLSGLPVMPASALGPCDPSIKLKVKVYLEGALTGAAAPPGPPPSTSERKPGDTFRDCFRCPLMTVVPAGSSSMGSTVDESLQSDERPVHTVTINDPFAVGVCEVTFAEYDACVDAGGCRGPLPHDGPEGEAGWGRGTRPVINVSWNDASSYTAWLSERTDEKYRLLTESEWEYAARAGTATAYSFGNTISDSQANYNRNFENGRTAPVGSYKPNDFGLYDVHGNVREWTEDCYHADYNGAPSDGSAWREENSGECRLRVLRGGSWNSEPQILRSARRQNHNFVRGNNNIGFRVARMLVP